MEPIQAVITYLAGHPVLLTAIGVFILLAAVGAWYVIAHHLGALLVTLLCAAGFASGVLVTYRGYQAEMRDLMGVGVFLMFLFPIIYQQAIKSARIALGASPPPEAKGHARRAGA